MTQLYLLLDSTNCNSQLQRLETCIRRITAWTAENTLLSNDVKTDVLHISSRFLKKKNWVQFLQFVSAKRMLSLLLRFVTYVPSYISVWPRHLKLTRCFNQLVLPLLRSEAFTNISTIPWLHGRRFGCTLYVNNSFMYSIPNVSIKKLQWVQNRAVRDWGFCKD